MDTCVSQIIFTKKLSEIDMGPYGFPGVSCEPSREDIEGAIAKGTLEERQFQADIQALNDEWNRNAGNEQEYFLLQKEYHARRIAFFVVNGWKEPIVLHRDEKTVKDGLHRLKAADYLNMEYVDTIVDVD